MGSLSIMHRGLGRKGQQEGFMGAAVTPTQGMELTCPHVVRICNPGRTRATSFLRMEAAHTLEQGVAAVGEVELRVELTA